MALALVPADEPPILPPKLAEGMSWYSVAPKSMLAGALILFAGVIGGLFARLEGKASDEIITLRKAVEQSQDNHLNRVAVQAATTETKVMALQIGMGKLTDAVDKNTEVNGKILQELARVRGILVAKGIDRYDSR